MFQMIVCSQLKEVIVTCCMIIKLGDIVQILGSNDHTIEYWYGEIVGRNGDQFEIYYITSTAHGVWEFEESHHTVEKESINQVARTKHGDYVKAWATFGFVYEPGPPIVLNEDPTFEEHSTGESESESLDSCDSWSTSDDESNISDFIDDEKSDNFIDDEKSDPTLMSTFSTSTRDDDTIK